MKLIEWQGFNKGLINIVSIEMLKYVLFFWHCWFSEMQFEDFFWMKANAAIRFLKKSSTNIIHKIIFSPVNLHLNN